MREARRREVPRQVDGLNADEREGDGGDDDERRRQPVEARRPRRRGRLQAARTSPPRVLTAERRREGSTCRFARRACRRRARTLVLALLRRRGSVKLPSGLLACCALLPQMKRSTSELALPRRPLPVGTGLLVGAIAGTLVGVADKSSCVALIFGDGARSMVAVVVLALAVDALAGAALGAGVEIVARWGRWGRRVMAPRAVRAYASLAAGAFSMTAAVYVVKEPPGASQPHPRGRRARGARRLGERDPGRASSRRRSRGVLSRRAVARARSPRRTSRCWSSRPRSPR